MYARILKFQNSKFIDLYNFQTVQLTNYKYKKVINSPNNQFPKSKFAENK